ncbi:MAG TPA: hypothetical protein VI278_11000 [Nitrososphaeraceae archaeon]
MLTSIGIVSHIPQKAKAQNKAAPMTPSGSSTSSSSSTVSSSSATPSSSTTTGSFLTYQNPLLGLKIQYPSNWQIIQRPYNATGNSTIASFLSPPQAAPATASPSGVVQGRFQPYVDIFVFDSKDMSLDQLINGSVNHSSLSNATISQSKPITLKGNNPAHMVAYSIVIADRYLFDRMQVWTKSGSKAVVISYTSEPQTYLTYLSTMQKMIQSIEIANSPSLELNNVKNQQHANASSDASPSASLGNTATGIPGLP